MKASLSIIQKLYEQGYVTYPRTNTEYLAEGEKETIKKVISAFAEKGYNVVFQDKKSIFDDTKIKSHSAITLTYKIPSGLSEDEEKAYETIKNRFLAVFCSEKCKVERTDVIITNTGTNEQFKLKGITVIQKGFLQYEVTGKENALPSFRQGEQIDVVFHGTEKITAPPKRYGVETLCNYLKSPFRTEKTSDDEAYKELFAGVKIGSESTRTQIIENAKLNQYISEKPGVYHLDPRRVNMLLDKVDVIVTDSPVILSAIYNKELTSDFEQQVLKEFNQNRNFNIFINRRETFETNRRILNQDESFKIDKQLKDYLKHNQIFYGEYQHNTIPKAIENIQDYVAEQKMTSISNQKNKKEEIYKTIQEIKQRVRIEEIAPMYGLTLVKIGAYLTSKEHDSLRIDVSKQKFWHNSQMKGGDVIDFVQHFDHLDFSQAVEKLKSMANITSFKNEVKPVPAPVQPVQEKQKDKTFALPK